MPSSISSSNGSPARINSATWAFIGLVAVLFLVTEASARYALTRVSTINRRIMQERSAALAMRPGAPNGPTTVLFAGNSLFLEGVDFPRLAKDAMPSFKARRYVIEATNYLDWYYGLRAMFRSGMRPNLLVLCFNPSQLITDATNGDFSARFMFDLPGIWAVARQTHAGATEIAELYASHFSTFYGARAQLRGAILGKTVPAVPAMWQKYTLNSASLASRQARSFETLMPVMESRLKALKDLCESNGSRFALLIPPTNQKGDTNVVQAGEKTGVLIMHPIANYSLNRREFYKDNFHLNHAGAALFTTAIEHELQTLPSAN